MTICAARAREEGHDVFSAVGGEGLLSAAVLRGVEAASVLVLPYPATRDGVHISGTHIPFSALPLKDGVTVVGGAIPADWHREHVLFFDLARQEGFLWENARLTAEGALATVLSATERGLYGLPVAVIGFGRIGKQLARLLAAVGGRVTVYARRPAALAEARAMGYGARTAVFPLTVEEGLVLDTLPPAVSHSLILPEGALCYDLGGGLPATLPDVAGGEVKVETMRGVPGVFAPRGAAEIYYDALRPYLATATEAGEEGFPTGEVVPTLASREAERRLFL